MSAALQLPKTSMTDIEWQTRCELAALYHVVNHLGWTDLINTHMSARIPDEPDTFLINNYGEMFDEITASSLVKMDMDGKVFSEGGRFNNAGFTIHSGVYRARPDAMCVMHTHTRAGAGISLLEHGLRPISQDALQVYDDVAYHEYGVPASPEECEALGRTCKHGSHVVLLQPRSVDTWTDGSWYVLPHVRPGARLRARAALPERSVRRLCRSTSTSWARRRSVCRNGATRRNTVARNGKAWCARSIARAPTTAASAGRALEDVFSPCNSWFDRVIQTSGNSASVITL